MEKFTSHTGVGVPPDELPRLFERFYKTDRSRASVGTGLGLAISKRLVGLMGGDLSLNSEPGHGTEFFFEISLAVTADTTSDTLLNGELGCTTKILPVLHT